MAKTLNSAMNFIIAFMPKEFRSKDFYEHLKSEGVYNGTRTERTAIREFLLLKCINPPNKPQTWIKKDSKLYNFEQQNKQAYNDKHLAIKALKSIIDSPTSTNLEKIKASNILLKYSNLI